MPYISKKGYMFGMPIATQPKRGNKKFGRYFLRRKKKTKGQSNSKRQRESSSVSFEEDEARKFSRIGEV